MRCRRLSCALGISHALSPTLVWPETLMRPRRLSCALGDFRALSATLLHSRRVECDQIFIGVYRNSELSLVWPQLSGTLPDSHALSNSSKMSV